MATFVPRFLRQLRDVLISSPADGEVLAYDSFDGKWKNEAAAGGGAQTFIGGISASDTIYTSGTVRLSGVGGGITVSSNTGQRIDLSVAAPVAQTVQTQNAVDLTLSGNTSGALALISSGTATLAGGNNITLSQAGNAITISGPNVAGAQTGISGLSNSEVNYTSGTVKLLETGAITIASGTGQRLIFSVNPQSVQPETQTFIGGVVGSDATYTSGTVSLSGVGGGVTVKSNTGQRVDISVAAQSVQPETQTFIAGVSASDTLYTSGNVRITGVGGGITVSSNTGQRIDLSVAAQSVQPETQTFIGGVSASNTLYTSGSVRFTGSNAVTVKSGTGQLVVIDVPTQTTQVETQTFIGGVSASDTLYTSGSVRFTGSNAVTVKSGTGQLVVIDVPVQSTQVETQTFVGGIANSQTTYTSGTVSLSELGAVTVRSTTGNQFQISVNAQSVQPETQTFIGGISASDTLYTSGSVRFTGSNAVTVKSGTGQLVVIDVPTQTAQTQSLIQAVYDGANSVTTGTVRLTNANGVTFSLNGQTLSGSVNQSHSLYAVSNTTQSTSGTAHQSAMSFAGAGGVSVGVSGGSVVISGGAGGAGDGGVFAGVSTGGNTAGSTGTVSTGNVVLVGTGPISLSQSTGAAGSAATISINAPATSSLSATGQVSVSTNASTISIGAPLYGTISMWPVIPVSTQTLAIPTGSSTEATRTTLTATVFPMAIEANLSVNLMRFPAFISITSASTNSNWSATVGQSFGVYTHNAGTLSQVSSFSNQVRLSYGSAANSTNASASFQMSYGSGAALSSSTSISTANAGNGSIWTSISGVKNFPLATGAMSMSPGQYFGAYVYSSLTAGGNVAVLQGFGVNTAVAANAVLQDIGRNTASTTAAIPLMGAVTMTQTNTGVPATFATADMTTANTAGFVQRSVAVNMVSQF